MTLDQLTEIAAGDSCHSVIASVILNSINDWPEAVASAYEFLDQLRKFIGGPVTRKNIEDKLRSVDLTRQAWYAESLAVLLDVFEGKRQEEELEKILERIDVNPSSSAILNM